MCLCQEGEAVVGGVMMTYYGGRIVFIYLFWHSLWLLSFPSASRSETCLTLHYTLWHLISAVLIVYCAVWKVIQLLLRKCEMTSVCVVCIRPFMINCQKIRVSETKSVPPLLKDQILLYHSIFWFHAPDPLAKTERNCLYIVNSWYCIFFIYWLLSSNPNA